MKPKELLISILLTTFHYCVMSQAKEIPRESMEDSELKFFQRIQNLNLDWDDIVGSYKNVSAEVETTLCKSKCKTTVALWVLQNLNPCDSIEKLDCPIGLVCGINCGTRNVDTDEIKRSTQKPKDLTNPPTSLNGGVKDGETTMTSMSFVPFYDDTDQEIYYPEHILDPIPNDESSDLLKV